MKVRPKGPLTIDGVALGATREDVDGLLGRPTTNANPAWARYYFDCGEQSDPRQPLLVSYRPAWPQRETQSWRVQSLCGSVLRRGDSLLFSAGDPVSAATDLLGAPDERFRPDPGFTCLSFEGCLITFDDHSGKIVEISLRFPSRLARLSEQAPAQTLLDGALAC